MSGRLEQARRWLEQPGLDDRGVGPQALGLILEEAKKVAEGLPAGLRNEILGLCSRVEGEQARLLEAVRRGEADNPQAVALARSLTNNIGAVADCIQGALVDRVVEDFIDIATPLKQFTDCVLSPGDPATREQVPPKPISSVSPAFPPGVRLKVCSVGELLQPRGEHGQVGGDRQHLRQQEARRGVACHSWPGWQQGKRYPD